MEKDKNEEKNTDDDVNSEITLNPITKTTIQSFVTYYDPKIVGW